MPETHVEMSSLGKSFRTLRTKLFSYQKRRLPLIIVLMLAATILEGLGLALILPLAAIIFDAGSAEAHPIMETIHGIFEQYGMNSINAKLWFFGAVYILIIFLRAGVLLLRDKWLAVYKNGFINSERKHLYSVLSKAPWPVLSRIDRANVLNTLTYDLGRLATCVHFFFNGLIQLVYIFGFLVIGFVISAELTAYIVAVGIVLFLLSLLWMRRSYRLGVDESKASRDVMDETHRFLAGLKTAQIYGAEAAFLRKFDKAIEQTSRIDIEFILQQGRLRRLLEIIVAIVLIVVFAAGYLKLGLTAPALLAMAALMLRMAPQLLGLLQGGQQVINALPAYGNAQATIQDLQQSSRDRMKNDQGKIAFEKGPIHFRDVTVRADADEQSALLLQIKKLSLPENGLVLIDGPSGAGKSTFAELVCGLRQASKGTITAAEKPITPAHIRQWQEHLAFLPQEPFLFYGSIRDNLAWPDLQLDDDAAWKALKSANIDGLIRGLPDKLDQPVLDGGLRFSGGERQRLCLARTFLRDAWIYVLDEPTANLDGEGEDFILKHLKNMSKSKLIMLISHNRSLAKYADQIVTIENGKVTARS